MADVIANKESVSPGFGNCLLVILRAEINDRRETGNLDELLEHFNAIAIAKFVAQQDDVIAGARELDRQMPSCRRIVSRQDGIRPVRCDMVHQQAAKIGLTVDDHDLDVHGTAPRPGDELHADDGVLLFCLDRIAHDKITALVLLLFFRSVVSSLFKLTQVFNRDIARDIFAGEARSIKFRNR